MRRPVRLPFWRLLSCLAFCLAPVLPAAADGGNMLVNPDFESSTGGGEPKAWGTWQKTGSASFRLVTDGSLARRGTACVAITQTVKDKDSLAIWTQRVKARPLTVYRMSVWMRTENIRPLTPYPYTAGQPGVWSLVNFHDAQGASLPADDRYYSSPRVYMTHAWKKYEISFRTPVGTRWVSVSLALQASLGTVYFDSASLTASAFKKTPAPDWLARAVVYEAGPWEFAQFGGGYGFRGLLAKLPDVKALGATVLYLLPIHEKNGWFNVHDHYSIFKKYGTARDLRRLVRGAHELGLKVILDFCGTLGVPKDSTLYAGHPDWFIRDGDGNLFQNWADLYGLDTNLEAVQDYFADVAAYHTRQFDFDGYRCDSSYMTPFGMFQKIRRAVRTIKPDAVFIAEDTAPAALETAFDAVWDWHFHARVLSLPEEPSRAGALVRWLVDEHLRYPPGGLRLRYLEIHDTGPSTLAGQCGLKASLALATLLFTIDVIPLLYNGQEAGNTIFQPGWWAPPVKWNGNPEAARYRATYTALAGLRARYPALWRGSMTALKAGDDRVAAYARSAAGDETVLAIINFSNAKLATTVDLSPLGPSGTGRYPVRDAVDGRKITIANPKKHAIALEPYQAAIFIMANNN